MNPKYFSMRSPCDNCPFRKDIHFYLSPDRMAEIAQSILSDQTFPCHKTIDYEAFEEAGHFVPDDRNVHCAGALIMLHRANRLRDNYLFRIAIWQKWLDESKLDPEIDVITLEEALKDGTSDETVEAKA